MDSLVARWRLPSAAEKFAEGIDNLETFVELRENDFVRLKLKTKLIKTIKRMQRKLSTEFIIEERLNEPESSSFYSADNINTSYDIIENDSSESNPYKGIYLDEHIHIDRVLERTDEGKILMELLQQNQYPAETHIKRIAYLLCDCLKNIYGCRPSVFYKNEIARCLVRSYPILSATVPDVPQAVFFHAHARGKNRHAGRIHYRMEYLARKSEERVVKRRRIDEHSSSSEITDAMEDYVYEEDLNANIDELKTITPNEQLKTRAVELWNKTVSHRMYMLTKGNDVYLNCFSVLSGFNGFLVSLDFKHLYPSATHFDAKWDEIEPKILRTHSETFKELKNGFIRALAVVRLKNPTRGAKKFRDDCAMRSNPMHGIMQWDENSDELRQYSTPIIIARGPIMQDSDCVIYWNKLSIPINNIKTAFEVLLQLTTIFKIVPSAADSMFFKFFFGAVLQIEPLSTTGTNFLQRLN